MPGRHCRDSQERGGTQYESASTVRAFRASRKSGKQPRNGCKVIIIHLANTKYVFRYVKCNLPTRGRVKKCRTARLRFRFFNDKGTASLRNVQTLCTKKKQTKGRARLDRLHACKARKGRQIIINKITLSTDSGAAKVREIMKKNLKILANNASKVEFRSLKAALNAVKQAAENDKDGTNGTRKYIEEIGITINDLNEITWQLLESICQKSKSGNYCPWYVLGALKKYADETRKERKEAEKLEDARRVNAKAKKIRAKKAEAEKAA